MASVRYKQCSGRESVRVRTRLMDRIGSGPRLVGWIGSGVWVSASLETITACLPMINYYPAVQHPASTHPVIACVDCIDCGFHSGLRQVGSCVAGTVLMPITMACVTALTETATNHLTLAPALSSLSTIGHSTVACCGNQAKCYCLQCISYLLR